MRFRGSSEVPEEVVENALSSYQFSNSASPREKMMIRQWKHCNEHGEFSVSVEEVEGDLVCTYESDGDEYIQKIPKERSNVMVEIYPIGEVEFEQIELMAVNLVGGFPWTSEAFNAWYWGCPSPESVEDREDWFEEFRVLSQYFPPRTVTSEPPECTVLPDEVVSEAGFMARDVRNATHCKTPNPWAYASLMVLYEDARVARELLEHENTHGSAGQYELTPPASLVLD